MKLGNQDMSKTALAIKQSADPHIVLYEWAVADIEFLVEVLAFAIMGYVERSLHILKQTQCVSSEPVPSQAKEAAIEMLEQMPTDHRDGWLFQFVSWVSSYEIGDTDYIRVPHPTPARHGFDGISIKLSQHAQTIQEIRISEDKATGRPRAVFTQEVLPEFTRIAKGERDPELRAEIESLLQCNGTAPSSVLQMHQWRKCITYKVAISTSSDLLPKRVRIFKDFETTIVGESTLRYGHLFIHDNFRIFFDDLYSKLVMRLKTMENDSSV